MGLESAPEIVALTVPDAARSDDDLTAAPDSPADARERRHIIAQAPDDQNLIAERQAAEGEIRQQMDERKPAPAAQMLGDLLQAIPRRAEENEIGLLLRRDDQRGNVPGARVDENEGGFLLRRTWNPKMESAGRGAALQNIEVLHFAFRTNEQVQKFKNHVKDAELAGAYRWLRFRSTRNRETRGHFNSGFA